MTAASVIDKWIAGVQEVMPDAMRESPEWKRLLPLAAGVGRGWEAERLQILLGWMWEQVLPTLQPIADDGGFGMEWKKMMQFRTAAAAKSVRYVRCAAGHVAAAAKHAAKAVDAVEDGDWYAETWPGWGAGAYRRMTERDAAVAVAAAAKHAAWAVSRWRSREERRRQWAAFDPVGTLAKLIAVEGSRVNGRGVMG